MLPFGELVASYAGRGVAGGVSATVDRLVVWVLESGDPPCPVRREVAREVLLSRGEDGALLGVAWLYRDTIVDADCNLLERPGSVTLLVRPGARGEGVGRRLVLECDRRWSVRDEAGRWFPSLGLQRCSAGGRRLCELVDEAREARDG